MENRIHYGLGKDYLQNWGIQQALREVYQNFIDYGTYRQNVTPNKENPDLVNVVIINDWIPESLDFLRIGRSKKHNANSIGKHGEGIKMAFLIFERLGLETYITTSKFILKPFFYSDPEIGECFCFQYDEHKSFVNEFTIQITCPKEDFKTFNSNVLTDADKIFTNTYGEIVDKPVGNIYSGNLFVATMDNMTKAYNIKPEFLPLDRDRCVPKQFDVSYYTSKINSASKTIKLDELNSNDAEYIEELPEELHKKIKPTMIGNSIEFTYKNAAKETVVIKNQYAKDILKRSNIFEKSINRLKNFIAKQLGLYDLLLEFQKKHVHSTEARQDFEQILKRVKKE